MKDKPMKYCQTGDHYVSHLWHRETSERKSSCKNCAPKSNLQRVTPIQQEAYKPQREAINKAIRATQTKLEDKTLPEIKKLATILFNRFIRKRDAIDGTHFKCISCGDVQHIDYADCGHYRPGTILELKFNEDNCSNECQRCNRNDPNHLIGYRVNLIEKIGLEKVLWLESFKYGQAFKMSKQDYLDLITKYKEK